MQPPASIIVTVYVPATVMPEGFCCDEVKPPGPLQENVTPVAPVVAVSCTVPPAQAGPLFDAVTESGGQPTETDALPVIDAVTVSVAVIVLVPVETSVTVNVCAPLSPAAKG